MKVVTIKIFVSAAINSRALANTLTPLWLSKYVLLEYRVVG